MSYEIPNQHKDPAVQAIVDSLEDNKAENVTVIPLKGKAELLSSWLWLQVDPTSMWTPFRRKFTEI